MVKFNKKKQKIIIKEKIIWQKGDFFILENQKNEKRLYLITIPSYSKDKIDYYKISNSQVFLVRSLIEGGIKMTSLMDFLRDSLCNNTSNIFEYDNVGDIRIYDKNKDKYESIPCGFSEVFSSYKVEGDCLNDRRFFLFKDSHEKKNKLILFNEDFTDFEEIENFYNLKNNFVIIRNNKVYLADKNCVIKEVNTTKKSIQKIKLKNISENMDKKVKAISFNVLEERKSFYEMDSKKENRRKIPKKVILIPFHNIYIDLNYTNFNKILKENIYCSTDLKEVYVEKFDENKKEIILHVITERTQHINGKKQTFYEIERQSYYYLDGKIYDKGYYIVIKKGKKTDIKIGINLNKLISENCEKYAFQKIIKPLYETIELTLNKYCKYYSVEFVKEGLFKDISQEEYEKFINELKI